MLLAAALAACTAGKGRYTYTDGSYFEGDWLDGCRVKGKLVAGGERGLQQQQPLQRSGQGRTHCCRQGDR
jgi:hypothetical protein